MVRVLCIVPLALAAVSAVSGHVIRQHKKPPTGWETSILQNYDEYHSRYLDWGCQKQHNTTFFDKCCHPLLNGEPISVIENLGCKAPDDECDDGGSPASPSTTTPAPSKPVHADTTPSASPSSSSKPANAALAKGNDTPTTSSPPSTPTSTPPSTPTSTPPKSSTSPAPAQAGGNGNGNGGDVHNGGQGTFFTQNGTPGACGTVHQDSDFICAIDSALFNKNICGKSVRITNTANHKTVTVAVADECPTCSNPNSVDLSTGAFNTIGDPSTGVLSIEWEFV